MHTVSGIVKPAVCEIAPIVRCSKIATMSSCLRRINIRSGLVVFGCQKDRSKSHKLQVITLLSRSETSPSLPSWLPSVHNSGEAYNISSDHTRHTDCLSQSHL